MILELLKSYVQSKAMQHPRYTWASSLLPLSRVNYQNIIDNGRNANLLVAGSSWIAKHFTEAPIRIWKQEQNGTYMPFVGAGSVKFYELYENPNSIFTQIELEMAVVVDVIYDGNGYIRKLRNENNEAIELWWCPSWTVEPKWDETRPTSFIDYYEYKPDPSLDSIRIRPEDMIHISWFRDPKNPRKGISPVKSLLREIYTDEKAANFASAIMRNMGVPGIILSPADNETTEPMTKEEAEAVKQDFVNRTTHENIGSPIIFDAAVKIDKIGFSPEELDLTALRAIPEHRVASVLGVYPEVLGFGSAESGANFMNMLETSYQSTVMFLQRLIAPKLKYDLLSEFVSPITLRRLVVEYDNTNVQILSRLMNEKAKRFGLGILYGWTEVAEGRFAFGLPVREEDRIYLRRKGTFAVRENDILEESIPSGDPASGEGGLSDGPAGEAPEDAVEMSHFLDIDTPEELRELLVTTRNGHV